MRYRQLPPAGDWSTIEAVWQSVPTDPAETTDCCARLCDRTAVERREHASEWLVFLSALGCVTDDGDGYYRSVDSLDTEALGDRFETQVFGVSEVLAVLDAEDGPLTTAAIRSRLEDDPLRGIERAREGYLARLLAWGVVFERFTADGAGYTAGAA
ncbi:hypothetical protein SAMN05216226_101223 [Halovenus aranensis]|jgi:hypothetical protein|uniref:Uncharacterized protein n=1 Tax=Halovenus aranensis TaxID=890420 RepID=A0A1G8S0M8_9EURY|nr:hypothetical protein [Halovenus aranensis]SDJ22768.1 hypothetical protein SAMN05216226_101223 [Halovenus aranensis]